MTPLHELLKEFRFLADCEGFSSEEKEFMEKFLAREQYLRKQKKQEYLLRMSGIKRVKLLSDFDWAFNPKIPREKFMEFMRTDWLIKPCNLVLIGPSGVGKTHAVKAIGHEAARCGHQVLFRSMQKLLAELQSDSSERAERILRRAVAVDLLILDDFAFRKLDQREAEMLYVLAEERLGRASTILTSNRPPEDWYAIFPDAVVGGAILDRLVSSAIKIITTKGRSYRREVMGAENRSQGHSTR